MNILNYKLQPKDVENLCSVCATYKDKYKLEELFIFIGESKQIHLSVEPLSHISYRKLTVQEIFLIRTLCK